MTDIRVRFAPSPTGFVHVGSLRTALYNYLFARNQKGKLVLRIEDTDRSRYVEGAVENLLRALQWAGLEYDEGPQKEGNFGPYFQSQRLDIYRDHIQKLIDKDQAYPCFCSEQRLEKMREQQAENNQAVMYDGHCRHIPGEEAQKRMKTEDYVIRMRIPALGETVVDDIIRGRVHFQNNLIDDQILIKSGGYPTYHFANVVDDHLMQISHVIRGEEWLPSTPKHVLLYQAFGWEMPRFAHLPLLLNKDRSKLSKRQGDVAVEDYQSRGILPQALLNFVALLGWNKGDDQELFSLDELVDAFSLDRVNKAGAVFDLDKLEWMNGQYLRNLDDNTYAELGLQWMQKLNLDSGDSQKNKTILLAVKPYLNTFAELEQKTALFFKDELNYSADALEWIKKDASKAIFKELLALIDDYPELTVNDFGVMIKQVQKKCGVKGKDLWMPVRAAMTGVIHGPELPVVLSVIGKKKVKEFLKQAIAQ